LTTDLKKTPLNSVHRRLGGKMVDFGGWDMPVQYPAGTVEGTSADSPAFGTFRCITYGRGLRSAEPAQYLWSIGFAQNDVTKLVDGQAHYSALMTPEGTVVDDLLVYRFNQDHLLLVVNAGTTDKDWIGYKQPSPGRKRSSY